MFAVPSLGVFGVVFFWALVSGLLVQLVVLPVMPALQAVHGLKNGDDWVGLGLHTWRKGKTE